MNRSLLLSKQAWSGEGVFNLLLFLSLPKERVWGRKKLKRSH
jgi:hypothetical protein